MLSLALAWCTLLYMTQQDSKPPHFLRNLWYFALHSRALKRGKLQHKSILGEPIVFGRTDRGEPFALRDLCPHRGVPLSAGKIREGTVECPYHGWRFNPSGQCTLIPSLVGEEGVDPSKIHVRKYRITERDGLIWVYMADETHPADHAIEAPNLPLWLGAKPALIETQLFPCPIDHAVVGLMDPAHGPFVHKAWWWRSQKSIHAKAKEYAPSHLGFTMVTHRPSSNSTLYRILGGDISTEISFQLPGIRVEHIKAGRNVVVGLTTCTPLTEQETEVTQTFFWTIGWLAPFKPIAQHIARVFLGQDRHMVTLQKEGLKYNPRLMLIQDADIPAIWYYRLKKEWTEAATSQRPFVNPVQEATLRWRS